MARGVLVEERREERAPELADAALAVDERDLAEPRRALVDGAAPAQRVGVRVGVDLDRAAAVEPHAQPGHERAAMSSGFVAETTPCVRSGSGVV